MTALAKGRSLLGKATQGEWSVPHFATAKDENDCDCTYVLSETMCGAVCSVHIDNGKKVSEGGNDCPPLEEAKANGELIAFAVNNLGKLLDVAEAAKQYVDSEEAEARAKIKCEIAECNYSNPEPEINAYTKAAVAAMDKRKALQSAIAKLEGV